VGHLLVQRIRGSGEVSVFDRWRKEAQVKVNMKDEDFKTSIEKLRKEMMEYSKLAAKMSAKAKAGKTIPPFGGSPSAPKFKVRNGESTVTNPESHGRILHRQAGESYMAGYMECNRYLVVTPALWIAMADDGSLDDAAPINPYGQLHWEEFCPNPTQFDVP
jgi:hypothetical protein